MFSFNPTLSFCSWCTPILLFSSCHSLILWSCSGYNPGFSFDPGTTMHFHFVPVTPFVWFCSCYIHRLVYFLLQSSWLVSLVQCILLFVPITVSYVLYSGFVPVTSLSSCIVPITVPVSHLRTLIIRSSRFVPVKILTCCLVLLQTHTLYFCSWCTSSRFVLVTNNLLVLSIL